MDGKIRVTGWRITSYGDESVGDTDVYWIITGDMFFDEEAHLEEFREELTETWELVCADTVEVSTFEELNSRLAVEEKYSQPDKDFENLREYGDPHDEGYTGDYEWER